MATHRSGKTLMNLGILLARKSKKWIIGHEEGIVLTGLTTRRIARLGLMNSTYRKVDISISFAGINLKKSCFYCNVY